jgi:hypothetical protein
MKGVRKKRMERVATLVDQIVTVALNAFSIIKEPSHCEKTRPALFRLM